MHGTSFPYQTLPKPSKATLKTIALPDPGSVQFVNPVVGGRRWPHAGRGAGGRQTPAQARERRSRAALVPARHVERAADQRRAQRAAGTRWR